MFQQDWFQKPQKQDKKEANPLIVLTMIIGLIGYPYILVGSLFYFYLLYKDKAERMEYEPEDPNFQSLIVRNFKFWLIIVGLLTVINPLLFIGGLMDGFLSCYLPFTTVSFNAQTLLALPMGVAWGVFFLLSIHAFVAGRRVEGIEEKQRKVQSSTAYQERRENRFEEAAAENRELETNFREAKKRNLTIKLEEGKQQISLGIDEYGKPNYIRFVELFQHVLLSGTTGSGKTTALMIFVEHACKYDLPLVFLDGKGARETLADIESIAARYGKTVKVLSELDRLRYNPVKHGNSVAIRDRLVTLARSESSFYTANAQTLLMNTIQLLDTFEIARTLHNVRKYINVGQVLSLFEESLGLTQETPSIVGEQEDLFAGSGFVEKSEEVQKTAKKRRKKETLIETRFTKIKQQKEKLTPDHRRLFIQLMEEYEYEKEGFMYLYKSSEMLRVNLSMLLDSELGYLFDTTDPAAEELDFLEVNKKKEIVFITLNGLVYDQYISMLGHFVISELNFMASEKYANFDKSEFLLIGDEPQSYLTKNAISSVNKGRGAGLGCIFSPQTPQDIEDKEEGMLELLIGSVNTYMIGQINSGVQIDYLAKLAGTYEDIEKTSMIEQQAGLYDIGKKDFLAQRGTVRDVERYYLDPKRIRALRKGEYYVYRKADSINERPKVVYMRKVS
ncbi:hypothetical protein ACSG6T_000259 [Enterococcus faecalis]